MWIFNSEMNAQWKNPGVFWMLLPAGNINLYFNSLGNNKTYRKVFWMYECVSLSTEKSPTNTNYVQQAKPTHNWMALDCTSFMGLYHKQKWQLSFSCCLFCTDKGTAVPLQAWSGPEGSRKLRFPDLVTMAQDGSKVVSLTHRLPLPLGNTTGTHFC